MTSKVIGDLFLLLMLLVLTITFIAVNVNYLPEKDSDDEQN